MKYLVIATGHNCASYVKSCLLSLKEQTFKDFHVSIVDDGSTDETASEIVKHIDPKWNVFLSPIRKGSYYAREKAMDIHMSYDIVVILDLDDRFYQNAMEVINKTYSNPEIKMTYGTWTNSDHETYTDLEYPEDVHSERSYRKSKFRCTAPRTFYKNIYDLIPKWKVTQSEIDSYPDAEIAFSLMEMLGKERIGIIKESIYKYHTHNPQNVLKVYGKDIEGYEEIINRPKRDLI